MQVDEILAHVKYKLADRNILVDSKHFLQYFVSTDVDKEYTYSRLGIKKFIKVVVGLSNIFSDVYFN